MKNMQREVLFAWAGLLGLVLVVAGARPASGARWWAGMASAHTPHHAAAPVPVSPNASPEAKALLQLLYSISGKHTLTGQHNYPNTRDTFTREAAKYCGKTPAVYSQDGQRPTHAQPGRSCLLQGNRPVPPGVAGACDRFAGADHQPRAAPVAERHGAGRTSGQSPRAFRGDHTGFCSLRGGRPFG
jgi:hypothetical protein